MRAEVARHVDLGLVEAARIRSRARTDVHLPAVGQVVRGVHEKGLRLGSDNTAHAGHARSPGDLTIGQAVELRAAVGKALDAARLVQCAVLIGDLVDVGIGLSQTIAGANQPFIVEQVYSGHYCEPVAHVRREQ